MSGDVKDTTQVCNTDHAGQRGPSSPLPRVRETVSWLVLSFLMDTEELEEIFRKTTEKGDKAGQDLEVSQERTLLGELSMTSQEHVPELPPSNSFLGLWHLRQTAKERAESEEGSESSLSPSSTRNLGETAPFPDLAQENRPHLSLLTFHEDAGGQKSKKNKGSCSYSRGALRPGPRFPNVCLESSPVGSPSPLAKCGWQEVGEQWRAWQEQMADSTRAPPKLGIQGNAT